MARVSVEFLPTACRIPTTDGRFLELREGELCGDLSLRVDPRDVTPNDLSPRDGVTCEFRFADSESRVWLATTRFTTELFIARMFDFTASWPLGVFPPSEADPEFTRAFETGLLLTGARFGSDDRCYRALVMGNRVAPTKFKYTLITLDVALPAKYPSYELAVAVRVGEYSLWDADEEGFFEPFGYYVACHHLLCQNEAVYDPAKRFWFEGLFPAPFAVAPTEEVGQPQENVRAEASA
jgi:hypothetical protein